MSTTTFAPSDTAKPTGRQVYKACALALQALGVEFPKSRRECSELIERLQHVANGETPADADDCPF